MSQRCNLPPSSSGLGRSPFKATTGVRIPVGAQIPGDRQHRMLSGFFLYVGSIQGENESFNDPMDLEMKNMGIQESLFQERHFDAPN